ncbi:MAG: hypothetical protein IT311_05340 [Anaerolineales bacterium]|nr:hypothetical protein [Anaerolineales bacterium]MCZ2120919.1 hypothetical protein [Anaerolineales bacterium]
MRNLIAFPLLLLAVILQSSVISQIKLISGSADLLLVILAAWTLQENVKTAWHWAAIACLLTSFVSRLPWFAFALGYVTVVYLAQALQRRVWQAPLLAMFSVTFAGTLALHLISFVVLRLSGAPLAFNDAFGLITLPSLLLNMLLAIPVYTFIRDLARWVNPPEE